MEILKYIMERAISLKLFSIIVLLICHEVRFVSLIEIEEELRLTGEENRKLEMACRQIINIILEA